MAVGSAYPVRVEATLDQGLSRWLWLVKWFLAIPHYVVLFFLWVAFAIVSVGAFFAILVTGRYPPSLFEFNVGVLRWSWRVAYYSYGALGTDRYPPFTLRDVPDYPAHLDVDHPDHLSRPLVLVKWWLLAIPHYLVVAVFAGGGAWAAWQTDRNSAGLGGGGLIGLLVLIAAVVLTVTGRYPRQIFDFVLGLNRWVLRVAAYAALMTDQYPPFRLDMGGRESQGTMVLTSPPGPGDAPTDGDPSWPSLGGGRDWGPPASAPAPTPPERRGQAWTPGRVVSVILGSVLAVAAVGLLAAGGAMAWLDNTQREASGYLTSDPQFFTTPGYAVTSDRIDLGTSEVIAPSAVLGTVRFRVTPSDGRQAIFVGVAPRSEVASYLGQVPHSVITKWTGGGTEYLQLRRAAPAVPPRAAAIWAASTSGSGTQTLTWKPTSGEWAVVVMNLDASRGVAVTADAGASLPSLGWFSAGVLGGGAVLLVAGAVLVLLPITRASRRAGPGWQPNG